jgi:3-methyladenine DNA glycosylase/8-oxoguanine DNA glycosylase
VLRARDGVLTRLVHVEGRPVVVHAWQRRGGEVALRAVSRGPASDRERALERVRFALAVDDDLSEFYAEFKRDPLLGPAIRRRPWLRTTRRPFAWEALAWAITEQLIESSRAAQIQRRIVRRWGRRLATPDGGLRDVPDPATIAALAPWELVACDLAPRRALALIRCAREVAAGRADPGDPGDDARFARINEIGPWTLACLGLHGRGEADSLPAGDLAYIKLVGVLARLGRRATVAEVQEFFAPYAPYRALAGTFALAHYGPAVSAAAHALSLAPDHYADAA